MSAARDLTLDNSIQPIESETLIARVAQTEWFESLGQSKRCYEKIYDVKTGLWAQQWDVTM
jgi:hypothetical protein